MSSDGVNGKGESLHFIRQVIEQDNASGKYGGRVHTRFPPEPNGYLHIGHAKSICLNFGLAERYGGQCNLRFDDTNPTKEEQEYVDSIIEDVTWLGFKWHGEVHYASDYFDQLYEWAVKLIKEGKAFVCDLTGDEIREQRGTLTKPGTPSPYRDRTAQENLDRPHGRGIMLMKAYMTDVSFNDRGNRVTMLKDRDCHLPHHGSG